jgi:hypothetical protein
MKNQRTRKNLLPAALVILGLAAVELFSARGSDLHMMRVRREMLCVTEGSIEERPGQRFSVSAPKMRAYVNTWTSQVVEARFTYLGSTGNEAKLGSGELRRQFGLKLRAQDPCNLVYAMWRIEPKSKLVVSMKTNPGQHTSAECANRGYRNIKPLRSSPVPPLHPGESHTLRAEMNGEQMRVWADNALVWEGSVGPEALQFNGPVGIRSDNVRLELELQAGEYSSAHPMHVISCKSGPSESE